VPRPRIEPLWAIGTLRALPRPPSTRLGCHTLYICIFIVSLFLGLTFNPFGTLFPLFIVNTVNHPLCVLFSCKALLLLYKLIKEGSVAAVDQAIMVKWKTTSLSTSLQSTPPTGWSTAGVADSNFIPKSLSFTSV
jgi:hypothetical protein